MRRYDRLSVQRDEVLIERHGGRYSATVYQSNCAEIRYHHPLPGIRPAIDDDYIKMGYAVVNTRLCLYYD